MSAEHALGSTPSSSQLPSTPGRSLSPPPVASRPGRSFIVELVCLLCGRGLGVLEADTWPTYRPTLLHRPKSQAARVTDWRRLRCSTCDGAAIPDEVTCRLVRPEGTIDWSAERPRRGRPPTLLAARRDYDLSST
jgi:hypothetical protein